MKINIPSIHRKSTRLLGYDYSLPGAYFITIVTHHREYLFGEVIDQDMQINHYGKIAENAWLNLPSHYPQAKLGAYSVMPNHIHGILYIDDVVLNTGNRVAKFCSEEEHDPFDHHKGFSEQIFSHNSRMTRYGVPEIIRAFKSFSARRINNLRNMQGVPIWQRSYYDHIIRDNEDLSKIWDYIQTNPQQWYDDQFH